MSKRGDIKRARRAWANERIKMERQLDAAGQRLEEDEAIALFKPIDKKLGRIGNPTPTLTRGKYDPRDPSTYRAAKYNSLRGQRISEKLKAERRARGETRREADRRRHQERVA